MKMVECRFQQVCASSIVRIPYRLLALMWQHLGMFLVEIFHAARLCFRIPQNMELFKICFLMMNFESLLQMMDVRYAMGKKVKTSQNESVIGQQQQKRKRMKTQKLDLSKLVANKSVLGECQQTMFLNN